MKTTIFSFSLFILLCNGISASNLDSLKLKFDIAQSDHEKCALATSIYESTNDTNQTDKLKFSHQASYYAEVINNDDAKWKAVTNYQNHIIMFIV